LKIRGNVSSRQLFIANLLEDEVVDRRWIVVLHENTTFETKSFSKNEVQQSKVGGKELN